MDKPIPILLYHSVAEQVAPGFRRWCVHPQLFAAHMAYLHEHRYTPLTVSQLVQAMHDPRVHLPPRPVVLTFDDALADFYTGALPVLTRYGFAATLYIPTGFVGGTSRWLAPQGEGERPMLNWQQIIEISDSHIECGAHSHHHAQLDVIPPAQARQEIEDSKATLEERLGQPVTSFAYPHGYYTSQVRQMVVQADFSSACAVKYALSALTDDCFALARLLVRGDTDVTQFAALLSGKAQRVAPRREPVKVKAWRWLRRAVYIARVHTTSRMGSCELSRRGMS